MKTILKPAIPEKAQYCCDVTGVSLPNGPAVSIAIRCGYGSPYDGHEFVLDLSESVGAVVLPLLRVLLLDGASLKAHLAKSYLNVEWIEEKPISRRERLALLCRLRQLCRQRKGTRPPDS